MTKDTNVNVHEVSLEDFISKTKHILTKYENSFQEDENFYLAKIHEYYVNDYKYHGETQIFDPEYLSRVWFIQKPTQFLIDHNYDPPRFRRIRVRLRRRMSYLYR